MSVEERYEYMICRPWCKQSNGETTKDVTQMVVEIMHVKVELGLGQGLGLGLGLGPVTRLSADNYHSWGGYHGTFWQKLQIKGISDAESMGCYCEVMLVFWYLF